MAENLAEQVYNKRGEPVLREIIEMTQTGAGDLEINKYLGTAVEEVMNEWDRAALTSGDPILLPADREEIRQRFFQVLGYGKLEMWLTLPEAENVHIFGADKIIVSYGDGSRKTYTSAIANSEELIELIRFLATTKSRTSRRFDTASPILDLRLPTGHRLFAIMGVSEEPYVVIRYHHKESVNLEVLHRFGTITEPMINFFRNTILPPHPANILIGGGTSTGKTTTLRSFLNEVPQEEILVTIEDTLELQLRQTGQHENCFELETRQANIEGVGEISMFELTRAALRMAPDRVVLGEVRGAEIMQLLNAMGQGNDGSIGTIHADSSLAVISRILTYSQRSPDAPSPDFVLRQIGQTLDMVIFISLLPGQRRIITSVREIIGYYDGEVYTSEIFKYNETAKTKQIEYLHQIHPKGKLIGKLEATGYDIAELGPSKFDAPSDIPEAMFQETLTR